MSDCITALVFRELHRATEKFPTWPTDPVHALAVLQEEVGELQREVLHLCYEPEKASIESVRTEAVQVAAMAIRFLESIEKYQFNESPRHQQ